MVFVPKIVIQTNVNEWDRVECEIKKSKIRRFPYKTMIGRSLTDYILDCKSRGKSSHQTIGLILREKGVIDYLKDNRFDTYKLQKNIEVSVCARFSEEDMRGR